MDGTAPTENATGKGTRRFGSLGQVATDLASVVRVSPELWRVYRGDIPPALRERIMVAVSHANACAGCSRVHQRWALGAGVTDDELEALGLDDLKHLDARSRTAVVYAIERSTACFPGPAGAPSDDPTVATAMAEHFSPQEARQVDAIARGITFANLSVGSAEALGERLAR